MAVALIALVVLIAAVVTLPFILNWFGPTLGPMELVVLVILAILLFGRKLPDVARWLGEMVVWWKYGDFE